MATEENDFSTKTPGEFSTYFMDTLQNELGIYDLQASKVGFLGFLINILANTTYDNRLYQNMLFKEAFPATAQKDNNLFLHGSIYNYNPSLATASVASGTIKLNFAMLPPMPSTSIRREVILGFGDPQTQVKANDVTFSSPTTYTFSSDRTSFVTTVARSDGSIENISSPDYNISVPFYDFRQEIIDIIDFKLPVYNYGTFYEHVISVDTDQYISRIEVYVKDVGQTSYIPFEIKTTKYFEESNAPAAFFKKKTETDYAIEFGSGRHGAWVPNSDVKLYVYKTIGVAGNMGKATSGEIVIPTQSVVWDYYADNTSTSQTIDTKKYFTIEFSYSDGGVNPLSGDELRRDLISYIQTRDNFISEQDFYNIANKYENDFRLSFKKMEVQENVFYLQKALRDQYLRQVYTLNHTATIYKDVNKYIGNISFEKIDGGELQPGNYEYEILAYDSFGNIIKTETNFPTSIFTENASVKITWDPIEGTSKYRIYGRDDEKKMYWETTEPEFLDDGSDGIPTFSVPSPDNYIIYPKYIIYDKSFISPFVYKYNKLFDWYDGYLFYSNLLVNFKSINRLSTGTIVQQPSIYLNLIYNQNSLSTSINVKSYQSLEYWAFYITIPELGIDKEEMTFIDESSYSYDYIENEGFLGENFTIMITGRFNNQTVIDARTNKISQIYDISDILRIPLYNYGGGKYLTCLPMIETDIFESEISYYTDKIFDYLQKMNYEENRMISDNVQFRFMNTYVVKTHQLENVIVQGRDLYNDVQWVSKKVKCFSTYPTELPEEGMSWVIGGSYLDEDGTVYENSPYFDILNTYDYSDELLHLNDGDSEDINSDFVRQFSDMSYKISPYVIKISGDQTANFRTADKIRIKNSKENNGLYTVVSVYIDEKTNADTLIEVQESLTETSNDGKLYYVVYTPWKQGGPDCIATYSDEYKSWIFTSINENSAVTVTSPEIQSYIYRSDGVYDQYRFILPLRLQLLIIVDKDSVVKNNIDLNDEKDNIIYQIAEKLQTSEFTGPDIEYYPSKIVDLVSETRRSWIKSIQVTTTDSNNPPRVLRNGIESLSDEKIRENLSGRKLEMVKFTSPYYWWDVDNIKITYTNSDILTGEKY